MDSHREEIIERDWELAIKLYNRASNSLSHRYIGVDRPEELLKIAANFVLESRRDIPKE